MKERIIEIEAESLGEARLQLKSKAPEGLELLEEKVVSDGKPKTVKAVADTLEEAFAKTQAEIPEEAEVLEKKEQATERETITIEAFDEIRAEREAISQIKRQFGTAAILKGLELAAVGSKGFLGIGKRPNQYEVNVLQPAVVEITYRTKAKISARFGKKPPDLLVLLLEREPPGGRAAFVRRFVNELPREKRPADVTVAVPRLAGMAKDTRQIRHTAHQAAQQHRINVDTDRLTWEDMPPSAGVEGTVVSVYRIEEKEISAIRGGSEAGGVRLLLKGAHQKRVMSMAFLADGKSLISGSSDKSMIWWNLEAGKQKKKWTFGSAVAGIAANPNGSAWAATPLDGSADVWLLPNGTRRELSKPFMGWQMAPAFSPDGKWYATGHNYGSVYLRSASTYESQQLSRGDRSGYPVGLRFSPSSNYLATSYTGGAILVWNIKDSSVFKELEIDRWSDIALLESPFQLVIDTLWLGDEGKRKYPDSVQVLDFETGEVVRELEDARGGMSLTPDGTLMVCCDQQGGVQLWDTGNWEKLASFAVPGETAICTAISFEHDLLAFGTKEGSLAVLDMPED